MSDFLISPDELARSLGTAAAPVIVDVRRSEAYACDNRMIPASRWRDHMQVGVWAGEIGAGAGVVVACVHGHNVSQLATSELRRRGIQARVLEGGVEAWKAAGLPTILKDAWPGRDERRPSRWVTRIRPKIDRIACPWLIRRFIDPQAEFLFVEPDHVKAVAEEQAAIAYDIDGVVLSHVGDTCTFDTLIDRFGISDPALEYIRLIVRGADTARLDLKPEAAGLLAVSLGISVAAGGDDHAALDRGFPVYDALYAWRRGAAGETHNWPSTAMRA